jgi:hypothetical protein
MLRGLDTGIPAWLTVTIVDGLVSCRTRVESVRSGNNSLRPEPIEQVKETLVCCLVVEKAEFSALRHVGDDLDGSAQIRICVPG